MNTSVGSPVHRSCDEEQEIGDVQAAPQVSCAAGYCPANRSSGGSNQTSIPAARVAMPIRPEARINSSRQEWIQHRCAETGNVTVVASDKRQPIDRGRGCH